MVIPGCPCTNERASAARVPLPLRRPARRLAGRPGLRPALGAASVAVAAALERFTDPRGRPGPRRRGAAGAALAAAEAVEPPTPASADAAASRRLYSSTRGFSSLSRSLI